MALQLSMGAVIWKSIKQQLVHGVFEKVKKYLKRHTNQCMAETSTIYLQS